jgi:hypothetical protein
MFLPLMSQQCFFSILCAFVIVGFLRGWCREVISLVFVLLAFCLIHPDTSEAFNCFLGRSGYIIAYLGGSSQVPLPSTCYSAVSFFSGSFWSIIIFLFLVTLGYLIGNRVFPEPRCALDRFFGILPAIISGAFILFYLTSYARASGEAASLQVQQSNPMTFVPVIFATVIIVLLLALIAACLKK